MALSLARAGRWLRDAVLILGVFLAVQFWQQRDVPSGPAPEIAGMLSDGRVMTLSAWRANVPDRAVALHFWAEWCPICATERGSIDALSADYPVLTVAMQSGRPDQVAAYMKKEGMAWQTLVDEDGGMAAAYGLKGVPALVVIDREGRIRSVATGYTTEWGMRLRLWWAERF